MNVKAATMNVELLSLNTSDQISSEIGDVFRTNALKALQSNGFSVKDLISAIDKIADGKVAGRTISGYLSRAETSKRNPTIATLQTMVSGFNALGVCISESDLLKRGEQSLGDAINIDAYVTSVKSALTVGMKVNASVEDIVLAGLVNYLKVQNQSMDDMALAESIFTARQSLVQAVNIEEANGDKPIEPHQKSQ